MNKNQYNQLRVGDVVRFISGSVKPGPKHTTRYLHIEDDLDVISVDGKEALIRSNRPCGCSFQVTVEEITLVRKQTP
ncbi:MAG: hypothetical protein XU15_C0011G0072 [candidate division NC10 bacterium CSP1-5]|nr:MAG: hypothetical protein XU15_C0011G0072 [candidate division NC10 bacterium CSP1-5]